MVVLQGIDALNRVSFDAAAHNVLTRSPIALPFVAPVTEEEDLKNLENLRQILTVLMKSGNSGSSGVGTVAGMTGGNAVAIEDASINSRSDTQVPSQR